MKQKKEIRYIAIGDSYTICEGVSREKSWPALLTKHLQKNGILIKLVANPSVTGWTTQQAIDNELPLYESLNPDFATLLIGVNDWVQGVSEDKFRKNLVYLIENMQQVLSNPQTLLLITIPDFSASPNGQKYANGRNISEGIAKFNTIIKQEAAVRALSVVDIYPISKDMKDNPVLIAPDGLHPSEKEYALWEEHIFPLAQQLLSLL